MAGTELARYLAVTSEHERKMVETRMSPMPRSGRSWRILGGVTASGKPSVFFIFWIRIGNEVEERPPARLLHQRVQASLNRTATSGLRVSSTKAPDHSGASHTRMKLLSN